MTISNVDRIYETVRRMAADFELKPDARIKEGEMARKLGVSRTPLREALNRLVAEGYLTFQGGHGFFCRSLTPAMVLDLYEARVAVETEAMRRSVQRASAADIDRLTAYLDETEPEYLRVHDPLRLLELDEAFHSRLCALSGNSEMSRMLENLNGRIRYVRMMDLKALREGTAPPSKLLAHRTILEALRDRDAERAEQILRLHIEKRIDDLTVMVGSAFSNIYVATTET